MKKKYFIVYRCVSAIINLNPNNIYIFDKQATHLAHVIKKKPGRIPATWSGYRILTGVHTFFFCIQSMIRIT